MMPSQAGLIIRYGLLPRLHKCIQIRTLQHISMAQLGIRYAAQLAKPLHELGRTAHVLGSLLHAEPCVRYNDLLRWFFISVSIHWSQPNHETCTWRDGGR